MFVPPGETVQCDLYQLFLLLENPVPQGEAPAAYRASIENIGVLYTAAIAAIPPTKDATHFQERTRLYFRDWARELYRRITTAKELQAEVKLRLAPLLERKKNGASEMSTIVLQLAREGRYEDIGFAVRNGSHKYHHRYGGRKKKEMQKEQEAILQALRQRLGGQ